MKQINFCRKHRMFKKMEDQDLQDISTSRSDEKTTTHPVLNDQAIDSESFCTHHPHFWERMSQDLLILRNVLNREQDRRIQQAIENAIAEFDDVGSEKNEAEVNILKVEDVDSMDATKLGTNNITKDLKEEQDPPGDVAYDWASEIRSSFKPCNLCVRDYGSDA